ncbi:MAG: CRISPR-associated protein Cas4 [Fusobacterium sp.]|uniref:CRISPR-associated protein Cas4 n=1 Tax=Fusobacterium sp. TaxID=68766 RepID=UPI002A753BFF|nr:CRISPR-associated protein Cas4 [Fusobacterium sp.]MDY2981411.1 CRISPR-associated protein Cas4 [Fusobacterium sp.]
MKKQISGTMFYYYFVCKRKLWFFSNGIQLEEDNEDVILGKLIDENSYSKELKHILIDNTVNIDFIKDWKILHEVKKQKSIEEAGIWQLKYYLYFLKIRGINIEKGILDYPKLKKREEVFLSENDEKKIKGILSEIEKITVMEKPPELEKLKICKKCAYFEYCYI